jgi:ribosomal protein L10
VDEMPYLTILINGQLVPLTTQEDCREAAQLIEELTKEAEVRLLDEPSCQIENS